MTIATADENEEPLPGWEPILPCCDPCPDQGDCDPVYCLYFYEQLSGHEQDAIREERY